MDSLMILMLASENLGAPPRVVITCTVIHAFFEEGIKESLT